MICPYCSLLCDADDLNALQCERRSASLIQFKSLRSNNGSFLSINRLADAKESLRQAKRILITGRIASVDTARAAIAFAAKHHATIDCAESGHVFKNALAIQRSGLNSVSLAEARDHSDLFIVVGNDSMQASIPRMPCALRSGNRRPQTVLLLGEFSVAATEAWRKAGFDTWSVSCAITSIPSALSQWSRKSDGNLGGSQAAMSLTNLLFERMAQAQYTTVVWSAENLQINQADLWVERLLQWIASRNEMSRCAALPWASMDATFQQVCTWLTGFPGRVVFRNGIPHYDPQSNSYEQWIARTTYDNGPGTLIVLIDETVAKTPFVNPMALQAASVNTVIELTGNSERFPTAIAGAETSADMFRADQTLLAHVSPRCSLDTRIESATTWLKGLST